MQCFSARIVQLSLLAALTSCADDSTPKRDAEVSEAGAPSDAQASNSDAATSSDAGAGSSDGSTSTDAGSTSTDAGSTNSDAASDSSAQASQDASSSSSDAGAGKISCDHRKVVCRIAEPACPANQVASVEGSCFGPCVVIDKCSCAEAAECPHEEMYVCHRSAKHCGPYVN